MKNNKMKVPGVMMILMGSVFLMVGLLVGPMAFDGDGIGVVVFSGTFGLVGLIIGAIGLVFMGIIGGSKSKMKLRETGIPVTAWITGVEQNTTLTVNGECPFRVICQFTEGGTVYICKSENLWYDPAPMLRGEQVTVYRDPAKPSRYYVDLSQALPEVVEL